jgi:hypothetical protein
MPRPAVPGCPLPQESCFAAHFGSLADASTAEIREAMAQARLAVAYLRAKQRRTAAMQAWLAENQLPRWTEQGWSDGWDGSPSPGGSEDEPSV